MRVHTDGQSELVDCLPDRVVDGAPVRDACCSGQEDTDELVASAHSPNLVGGRLRVLCRDDEHPPEPWFFLEPALEEEFVVRGAELRGQLRVREEREHRRLVGLDDPDVDAVAVEVLLAKRLEGDSDDEVRRVVAVVVGIEVAPNPPGGVVPRVRRHREPV